MFAVYVATRHGINNRRRTLHSVAHAQFVFEPTPFSNVCGVFVTARLRRRSGRYVKKRVGFRTSRGPCTVLGLDYRARSWRPRLLRLPSRNDDERLLGIRMRPPRGARSAGRDGNGPRAKPTHRSCPAQYMWLEPGARSAAAAAASRTAGHRNGAPLHPQSTPTRASLKTCTAQPGAP